MDIILVNDGSTDPRYYTKWPDGVTVIHLGENTRKILGYPCVGYVRNCGIRVSRGDYLAFCDDDDAFYPDKIQKQITFMRAHHSVFSCTDAIYAGGTYRPLATGILYNGELQKDRVGKLGTTIPMAKLRAHNMLITSAVMIHKIVFRHVGMFNEEDEMGGKNGTYEDYDMWLRIAKHYKLNWLNEPLSYYDAHHGGGQQYTNV